MAYTPIIAVDFDGTLSLGTNYPRIGQPNQPLIDFLLTMQSKGFGVVLWTCREGEELDEAVDWCKCHGLEFDAVNENPPYVSFRSRKVVAEMYIDDRACDLNQVQVLYKEAQAL